MNILHLSDIHFGRNYPEYGLNESFEHHDEILDGIIHEMETMDDTLKPEHIICTGDMVWHGKRREYREALEWFRRLLKACHLTGKDISFCVGNHDMDLSCQYDDMDYDADMVAEIDELYRYENIHKFENCLNAYNEFCREIGTMPYSYPSDGKRKYSYSVGYKDVTFSDGKILRIFAMNTALLMTQKKIPDDKMWLGREQLKSMIQYGIIPASEDIWYTVCLFHHSERFLHPNETSTYDGRSATLPSLMGYVNLLVCGHTESSGRPRLAKQPGGGTMLLGGAAYYNDQHINSFSMIYISDKKKSMGYIPYIYEGEWKDYDFCSQDYDREHHSMLEKPGEIQENIDLVIESKAEQFKMSFEYLEFKNKGEQIDSRMDLMNHFCLEYDSKDGEEVTISCPKEKRSFAKTLSVYHNFMEFMKRVSEASVTCYLRNQQGELLKEFQGISFEKILKKDDNFIKDILFIEDYYDVKFTIPNRVNKKDYEKIDILKNIAMNGFTDKVKVLKSFRLKKSYEEMLHLYESALVHNEFGIYGEEFFSIRLFDVNVMLGKVLLCAGPFCLDLDDIKYKLDTYQKHDERYCYFNSHKQVDTYIIKDRSIIKNRNEQPSFTLIDDYGELGFSLDL